MLVVARISDLRSISLDTSDYTDISVTDKNISHSIAVDYDRTTGYIYWTDDEVHAIQRCYMNGSGLFLV